MKSFNAMMRRMDTLPARHCIVCRRKARRVYAHISHTETVICTKRCFDEWDAAVGRVEVKPNARPHAEARSADSVQADVRFCSWTWDTTEQRWLTRCGYGFAPASDRDHTGKVLPFPFCPYCGAQTRKPNAPREGQAPR